MRFYLDLSLSLFASQIYKHFPRIVFRCRHIGFSFKTHTHIQTKTAKFAKDNARTVTVCQRFLCILPQGSVQNVVVDHLRTSLFKFPFKWYINSSEKDFLTTCIDYNYVSIILESSLFLCSSYTIKFVVFQKYHILNDFMS